MWSYQKWMQQKPQLPRTLSEGRTPEAWCELLQEMRHAIGATRAQFNSLVEEGLLVPKTKIATIKSPWRLQDGLDFLDTLTKLATRITVDEAQWEQIQQAKKRSGLSVRLIIEGILKGRPCAVSCGLRPAGECQMKGSGT